MRFVVVGLVLGAAITAAVIIGAPTLGGLDAAR